MFVFKANEFLAELEKHHSDIYRHAKLAYEGKTKDLDFIRVDEIAFEEGLSDSIDYAVMEKARKGKVVSLDAGWNDVGSFSFLWDVLEKDENGNTGNGHVTYVDTANSLVHSEQQYVATIGVKDVVVVSSKDSLLVADKSRVKDVKTIVKQLEASDRSEHLLHREVFRPWGSYDSIDNGERFQVKRIVVKPGASLSKQMHHHRAEHWIVVSGTAIVEIDEKETMLTENQSIYIPLGAVHRLTNPGKVALELIEVQSGSYLGEDDIVRINDVYGRV